MLSDDDFRALHEQNVKWAEEHEYYNIRLHWPLYWAVHAIEIPGAEDVDEKVHFIVGEFMKKYLEDAEGWLLTARLYMHDWNNYWAWKNRIEREKKEKEEKHDET